jgi:hypothetical protein
LSSDDPPTPNLVVDPQQASNRRELRLSPAIENARKATEAQGDKKAQNTLAKRRGRKSKSQSAENLVVAGKVRAKPPAVIDDAHLSAAIDGLLAEDGDPAAQRAVRGRYAQEILKRPGHTKPGSSGGGGAPVDNELGEAEWLKVYDAYAQSGIPAKLAELSELPLKHVEHLLDLGVQRLNLPPIREHASRTQVVHDSLLESASQPLVDHRPELSSLPMPIEQAITTRAVRESAAAEQCLNAAVDANEIFNAFVQKMLEAVRRNSIDIGEPVRMTHLEMLSKALNANTQAMERAIKLSRLVRGETTDQVSQQITALLVSCSVEELEEAERKGTIPSRLLNRYAGGKQESGPLIIDVNEDGQVQGRGQAPNEATEDGYAVVRAKQPDDSASDTPASATGPESDPDSDR